MRLPAFAAGLTVDLRRRSLADRAIQVGSRRYRTLRDPDERDPHESGVGSTKGRAIPRWSIRADRDASFRTLFVALLAGLRSSSQPSEVSQVGCSGVTPLARRRGGWWLRPRGAGSPPGWGCRAGSRGGEPVGRAGSRTCAGAPSERGHAARRATSSASTVGSVGGVRTSAIDSADR
jgi:hypothetical protein